MADWYDDIDTIDGWCREPEARLLHKLASGVPAGGAIVEIGSYKGRSTLALVHGSHPSVTVWSIDAYPEYTERDRPEQTFERTTSGRFIRNMVLYAAADRVKMVHLEAERVALIWREPVDMVYIDANHEYPIVYQHALLWHEHLVDGGVMAFHDDDIEDVSTVIKTMHSTYGYTRIDRQGALTALRKPEVIDG